MSSSRAGTLVCLALSASALSGCEFALVNVDRLLAAPYPNELRWEGSETATTTTTSFKTIAGTTTESTGSVGAGTSCGAARASSGTRKETRTVDATHSNEVVGNTVTDHPLNPGGDTFGRVGVSVVAEQIITSGKFTLEQSFNAPDAAVPTWSETSAGDTSLRTAARYHGVAADEYVVSLFPLDLWVPTEEQDTGGGFVPFEGNGSNQLTLLTRHKPVDGDIWSSLNNRILYVYDGTEKLNIGGKSVTADRIRVYTNGDFDPSAGDVFGDCLLVGPFEDTTTLPGEQSLLTEMVTLDPGCANQFKHQQIGTEWWFENVLVQSELTTLEVAISDFGWEWYEDEEGGCSRRTGTVKPTDTAPELFVEYTVTESVSQFVVDTWEVGAPKE